MNFTCTPHLTSFTHTADASLHCYPLHAFGHLTFSFNDPNSIFPPEKIFLSYCSFHCSMKQLQTLLSHLFIDAHVHHPIQLYTQLLQLYFPVLLPPHRSASQHTFASVKTVNSFILQELRHYLEYWNSRNMRHIMM